MKIVIDDIKNNEDAQIIYNIIMYNLERTKLKSRPTIQTLTS